MPLTFEEREILKSHPENGVEIIKPVKSLEKTIPIILHHNEKFDGRGFKGRRDLTVVDSFDAMTTNRPYNRRKDYGKP